MPSRLVAVSLKATKPTRLAAFWAELLGWDVAAGEGLALVPGDDTGFELRFRPTSERKIGKNQAHFDLTSASLEGQRQTVARALDLGAQRVDVGQGPEARHVVLADPEGNEFCVIEPGNNFLADCGFLGAVACDGSQDVGYFWSAALGWPLVWDQDQETAIRSPHGGPKLTWGGTLPEPDAARDRLSFELGPVAPADQQSEVDRLVSLGASRVGTDDGRVLLNDLDGNRFALLPGGQ